MSRKIQYTAGAFRAVVSRSGFDDEYKVQFYRYGIYQRNADYFSDKEDCQQTAQTWTKTEASKASAQVETLAGYFAPRAQNI